MGRIRETNKVAIEITQVRDDGFLDQDRGVEVVRSNQTCAIF